MEKPILCQMKFICKNCKHPENDHTEEGDCRVVIDRDNTFCPCEHFEADI